MIHAPKKDLLVWILASKPSQEPCARLFCFPHAGASGSVFRRWSDYLREPVEVCAAELPGRAARQQETACQDIPSLLDAAIPAILPLLDKPFALFGHSMGALIAFEIAHRLASLGKPTPDHLFVFAEPAPKTRKPSALANLTDDQMVAELRRLDGTPRSVLDNAGMREYFLPIVRADFRLLDSYNYKGRDPLSCPITAFGGSADQDLTPENLELWKIETNRHLMIKWLNCGHFHTLASERQMVSDIEVAIRNYA